MVWLWSLPVLWLIFFVCLQFDDPKWNNEQSVPKPDLSRRLWLLTRDKAGERQWMTSLSMSDRMLATRLLVTRISSVADVGFLNDVAETLPTAGAPTHVLELQRSARLRLASLKQRPASVTPSPVWHCRPPQSELALVALFFSLVLWVPFWFVYAVVQHNHNHKDRRERIFSEVDSTLLFEEATQLFDKYQAQGAVHLTAGDERMPPHMAELKADWVAIYHHRLGGDGSAQVQIAFDLENGGRLTFEATPPGEIRDYQIKEPFWKKMCDGLWVTEYPDFSP